jgi:hypothetical protein
MVREASDPAKRPGSAWQNTPGLGGWWLTLRALLRGPAKLFRSLRVNPDRDRRLLVWNCAGASLVLYLVLSANFTTTVFHPVAWIPVFLLLTWSRGVLVVAMPFVALSVIEAAGVRYFSSRRGWRMPRDLARAICAHASFGWIAAPIGLAAGLEVTPALERVVQKVIAPGMLGWLPPVRVLGPTGGFVLGLLVFESLVAFGARTCRFANLPGPDAGPSEQLDSPDVSS